MINTIDSFQGQEKDLIIISTVRSNDKKQIGFLIDERRINVALTRAKFSLIIIGNGDTLSSNEVWNQLLSIAEQKKLYFEVNASEDEDLLLVRLNKEGCFNEGKVTRKQYRAEELTCDPRKQEVKEMKVEDFRRVIKKHKEQVEKSKGRDYADDEKISNKAKVNE
jgi:ATP-dependent exoDNAse (exonuclease V) beta subunit